MTRVKVCGITNLDDALAAVDAGADALGFVFAPSPRRVTARVARGIIGHLPPFVTTVGVFVDAPAKETERIAAQAGVDVIQLHGDESAEYCARFAKPVIKRFAVSEDDTERDVSERVQGYRVSAFLLDPGAGSGVTFPWQLARAVEGPVIIAGGLNPGNVRLVIRTVKPFGVDVSSGVEERPGKKHPDKLYAFVRAVRKEDGAANNVASTA